MTRKGHSITEIHRALESSLGLKDPTRWVEEILIDSRRLNNPTKTLFFALVGERHDGHNYVRELYGKGVRNFVISHLPRDFEKMQQANFLKVSDSLDALQQLAAMHREGFDTTVVGITGSNGKTVVKEWLFQLLSEDRSICRSPKSFNSQVGVPLSVWNMAESHDLALFEAGISRPGEMNRLQKIIQPGVGLFTHLGDAHGENFESDAAKVDEKLLLFRGVSHLYYGRDQQLVHERIEASRHLSKAEKVFWSADDSEAALFLTASETSDRGTRLTARYNNEELLINIPFTDQASIENAMLCWLVLLESGMANPVIANRMARLSPVGMRLELREGKNASTLINDSYNSDLGSLRIALDLLQQQKQHPKKTLILSDILESGSPQKDLYEQVSELVNGQELDRFIGVGPQMLQYKTLFQVQQQRFFENTEDLEAALPGMEIGGEAILLKGARYFGFETISEYLQQQSHETVLEINLNALVNNLNYYRSKLSPGTRMMAMVKAFSYGSGTHEIANILQFNRVDYLGVAYTDEGVELRKAGITLPIMVMSPEQESFSDLIHYNLEPEIYSIGILERFGHFVRNNHLADRLPFNIHLKIDTGMHRLGFEEKDLNELLALLDELPMLRVKSIFSHLAASEDPAQEDFTRSQISRFESMSDQITDKFSYKIIRHILNSAGISRFPGAHFDLVRLGIGMYGISGAKADQHQLEPVGSLKTTITQIKQLEAGETIGYGRAGKADEPTAVATVSIGYADGLSRKLGLGRGHMLIHGQQAPIIGQVCMDMCMLDVTGLRVEEGDEVTVFGPGLPIETLAGWLDTIPYEILTGISRRVKRVYYHE